MDGLGELEEWKGFVDAHWSLLLLWSSRGRYSWYVIRGLDARIERNGIILVTN